MTIYKKHIAIILISLVVLIINSCKKDDGPSGSGPIVKGSISLEAHAVHHTWDVYGIMIYLKRNATEFPGNDTSVYEYSGVADSYGKYTFENLYPGNYFVYAAGFDNIWGDNVAGYAAVVLDNTHLTDNQAKITIIVSE